LAALGRRCRDEGVRLLYHNHDFELTTVEGRTGLAWLLDAADPADLGLEPDLGWIQRAGLEPSALLAAYPDRCPRVHVKDLSPADRRGAEGGWTDVGDGVLDWPALLPACRRAGAEWFVVEHDEPADPIRTARRSAEHLRALL
jgi:sugar phosphate isomerase/epimerase